MLNLDPIKARCEAYVTTNMSAYEFAEHALESDIPALVAEVERLTRFRAYWDDMYGQGYKVANWHLNGDLEPLDGFIDSANDYSEATPDAPAL